MKAFLLHLCTIILMVMIGSACSTAETTPEGQQLGTKDLSSFWSAEDKKELDAANATSYEKSFAMGKEKQAEGKVIFETVTHPKNGGQYLKNARVSVVKNQDYVITLGEFGNASNMGTPEKPLMSIPFTVNFGHKNGRSNGTVMLTIDANGMLKAQ